MTFLFKMFVASVLTLALLVAASPAPAADPVHAPSDGVVQHTYKYGPYGSRQRAYNKAYYLSRQGWKVKVAHEYDGWYVYAW